MKKDFIIIAYYDNWTATVITKDNEDNPIRLKHTLEYVRCYLINGNGSFIARLISVFRRLFTNSLKPSQVSASKCGTTIGPLQDSKVT